MELDGKEIKAQVWDTAVQERFRTVTFAYYKGAVGALIIYDITRRTTFDSIKRWLDELKKKFDNTSAMLTYERSWQKKVPLNKTLFGNYEVLYINYPGLPSSPPFEGSMGNGPSGSAGSQQFPITADIVYKDPKVGRPSNAVGPVFTPAANKRLR
ncbi:unnamed protein product [Camellia sinensis]